MRQLFDLLTSVLNYVDEFYTWVLNLFTSRRTNLVAIDIGASSIKVVEIGKKNNKLVLVNFVVTHLPDGCVNGHSIQNYSMMTEKLQEFVNLHNYNGRDAAIILSGPQVITQIIKIPNGLEDHQLVTQVELEAEKWLPFKMNEIALDFDILNVEDKKHGFTEILLAATKRSYVDEFTNILKAADLNVRVMDVYSCVAARLSVYTAPKQLAENLDDKVIAMLDLGHNMITLSIYKDEKQLYIKDQNFGGKALNQLIQQEHGVNFEISEKLKYKHTDPAISKILETFNVQLANQVYHMLQQFYSSAASRKIDHVFIFGGCANLPNIDAEITTKIEIPVKILDVFTNIDTSAFDKNQEFLEAKLRLSPACGLALRSYIE